MSCDGQLRVELAVAENLHVLPGRPDEAGLLQQLGRDLRVRVEAGERGDVDRLRVGAERADRHRVLRRGAALLAGSHVDGHLAALEAGAHLVRAGTRLLALDAAARIASLAGAETAAHALTRLAALRRLEVRQVE